MKPANLAQADTSENEAIQPFAWQAQKGEGRQEGEGNHEWYGEQGNQWNHGEHPQHSSCAASWPLLFLLGLMLFAAHLPAATNNWLTNAASGSWTNPADWGGTAPVTGNLLQFSNSTTLTTLTNDFTGFSFLGLNFTTNASAYTVGGNQLTLTGGITNSSANLQTLNFALIDNSGLVFTTLAGGGNLLLGGVISGAGALTITGSGTTTFINTETYTGGTLITSGTLQIGNGATAGSVSGNVTNNASLIFNNTNLVSGGQTIANNISGSGSLTLIGSTFQSNTILVVPSGFTLSGVNSFTNLIVTGLLQYASDSALGATTGTITLNGGETIRHILHHDQQPDHHPRQQWRRLFCCPCLHYGHDFLFDHRYWCAKFCELEWQYSARRLQ